MMPDYSKTTLVYADDPQCERWTAITSESLFAGCQLRVEWRGDDLHVVEQYSKEPNAVSLAQALPGNRFPIATRIDGVAAKRRERMTKHD